MTVVLLMLRGALPEGVPVPWLHTLGVSSALVHAYVRSGWLKARPGQAYLRPGPALSWPAAFYAAQQLGLPVHLAHLSALARHGLTHHQPLGVGGSLHLSLSGCPPVWLARLPVPVVWHHDALLGEQVSAVRLNPPSLRHAALDLPVERKLGVVPVPDLPWTIFVSAPERGALELAAGLSRGDRWDTAYETFSGLSMLSRGRRRRAWWCGRAAGESSWPGSRQLDTPRSSTFLPDWARVSAPRRGPGQG